MIGYAYVDLDSNLVYKVGSYIEEINPGFFGMNRHLISKHWRFDTEDASCMLTMFKSFSDLGIHHAKVVEFVQSVGYDMNNLKNANKV
jgi:hypothetical protein